MCFIGKVRLPEFLQQKLQPKEGKIVQVDKNDPIYNADQSTALSLEEKLKLESQKLEYLPTMGKVVGKHQGAHYFTVGQRKGLNVGGTTDPLFVIATDVETNTIYTGLSSQHQVYLKKHFLLKNLKCIGLEKT